MELWKLFTTALMPVLKVLLITGLGSFLALHRFNILRESARKHLNAVCLIFSSLCYNLCFSFHTFYSANPLLFYLRTQFLSLSLKEFNQTSFHSYLQYIAEA